MMENGKLISKTNMKESREDQVLLFSFEKKKEEKMSTYYKVALAVDANDYDVIASEIKTISEMVSKIDRSEAVKTPDNEYSVLYWNDISWDAPEIAPLLRKLEGIRHALVTIDEDKDIVEDFVPEDSRGVDEEFNELLAVEASMLYWPYGEGLTPLVAENSDDVPISRSRLVQLLKDYMSWDLNGIGSDRIFYDNLIGIGFSHDEIIALGFGFCISAAAGTGISDIINEKYPELVNKDGSLTKKCTFNIGFFNPPIQGSTDAIPGVLDDGIANDETQLESDDLYDLESLYCDFCDENDLPYDTVKYVDLAGWKKPYCDRFHCDQCPEYGGDCNGNINLVEGALAEECVEHEFKEGDRVRLLRMPKDPRPVPPMTEGTVKCIDDAGQIHVSWDNGQSLALIPGTDRYVPVSVPSTPCVVIVHSFHSDTPVYEYDTDEEAAKALHRHYNEYLAEEKREGSLLNEEECFCEDNYARITWADGCRTEFILSFVSKEV